jgi:hypothetical protein
MLPTCGLNAKIIPMELLYLHQAIYKIGMLEYAGDKDIRDSSESHCASFGVYNTYSNDEAAISVAHHDLIR